MSGELQPLASIAGAMTPPDREDVRPIGGKPGMFRAVALSALVIDKRFQRVVSVQGVRLIRQIAAGFDWTKFTPLIVAPVGEGKHFAIIDGQHRALAAFLRGDIKDLPCWVVQASLREQGRAFVAINGERTKMAAMAVWHAQFVGGEPDALHLFDLLAKAGCELARYPLAASKRPPHVTLAGTDIMRLAKVLGDGPVIKALRWLRLAGEAAEAPLLVRAMIEPVARVVAEGGTLADEAAAEALAEVDVDQMRLEATQRSRMSRRTVQQEAGDIVRQALARFQRRAA